MQTHYKRDEPNKIQAILGEALVRYSPGPGRPERSRSILAVFGARLRWRPEK